MEEYKEKDMKREEKLNIQSTSFFAIGLLLQIVLSRVHPICLFSYLASIEFIINPHIIGWFWHSKCIN